MPFTGQEGAPIDAAIAGDWTRRYRTKNPGATQAHFFGRVILEQLLAESGSKGIRLYYGLDPDGARQLLAVAADGEENDMLGKDCIVADESVPCPLACSDSNVLNT